VSPAGAVAGTDGYVSGHVLDGGYFENYGAVTLLEAARSALRQLHEAMPDRKLQPIIVQISSDPELPERDRPVAGPGTCGAREGDYLPYDRERDSRSPWRVAQEALAPVGGIYGTRGARGVLASKELSVWAECWAEREVGVKPVFVHFAMCDAVARPPLGWVMTGASRHAIHSLMPAARGELIDAACNEDALARFERAWWGGQERLVTASSR
jgi:hypothetical protein